MLLLENTIFHKCWLFCQRFFAFTSDLCGLLSFVYSVYQSAPPTGFRTDFTSSVWNFCRWNADVPPREKSSVAKSEEKRMFSQAREEITVVETFQSGEINFQSGFKGEGIANSHVTFGRVNALVKWFWGHPFHRKFFRLLWVAHIFINLFHQPKVWHFNLVVMANKNITGSKVSVNKIVFCEMVLITIGKRTTQLKLSQTIIS